MSLSPFDSFQSRFVTYLLNCPRVCVYIYISNYTYVSSGETTVNMWHSFLVILYGWLSGLHPAYQTEFLFLCTFIVIFRYYYCYVYSVLYILFSSCQLAVFGYPDWGFFVLFPSVVSQMPGYKSQRRGTVRLLPKLIVLFCVLFVSIVLFYILFVCKDLLYYCHRVSTQLQITNISIYVYINILRISTNLALHKRWYISIVLLLTKPVYVPS
jgi:hypothetical protein